MTTPSKTIAAITAVAALAVAGGTSIADDSATQITVSPVATIMPGQKAPFDAAGVKAIRRGKPVPAGYRLIGQKVTIARGVTNAGASLFFRCPDAKRLKTFGLTGELGPTLDPSYVDKHQTYARVFGSAKKGATVSGISYAVCR
jgi:hypothetical protein